MFWVLGLLIAALLSVPHNTAEMEVEVEVEATAPTTKNTVALFALLVVACLLLLVAFLCVALLGVCWAWHSNG
jgi:hypothetical protein